MLDYSEGKAVGYLKGQKNTVHSMLIATTFVLKPIVYNCIIMIVYPCGYKGVEIVLLRSFIPCHVVFVRALLFCVFFLEWYPTFGNYFYFLGLFFLVFLFVSFLLSLLYIFFSYYFIFTDGFLSHDKDNLLLYSVSIICLIIPEYLPTSTQIYYF